MSNLQERVQETFGVDELKPGLFYRFDYALRFELGGEEWGSNHPIRRFLQAYTRATQIAEIIFQKPDQVHALVSSFGNSEASSPDFSRLRLVLPTILRSAFAYRMDYSCDDSDLDDDTFTYWHEVQLNERMRINELLWMCCAVDMVIKPSCEGFDIFLVDFEKAIVLHAYDDRGLDIVAMEQSALFPLYNTLKEWLFDYDMARMRATFEGI